MPLVTLTALTGVVSDSFLPDWDAESDALDGGTTLSVTTGTGETTHAGTLLLLQAFGTLTDDSTTVPLDAIISDITFRFTWTLAHDAPLALRFGAAMTPIAAPGASGSFSESTGLLTRADLYGVQAAGWQLFATAGDGTPHDASAIVSGFAVDVTYTLPTPGPVITLNTLDARTREGVTIQDALNDAPNTCGLTVEDATSPLGQAVRIAVNPDAVLLFNGTIQTVTLTYDLRADQIRWDCTATDDLAQFNRRLPFGTYDDISATTVAEELIATYAPGFSDAGIEAALPNVSIALDGSTSMGGAFAQMAALIGGAFKVEDGVAYLFLTDTADAPDDIDDTPGRFLDEPRITMTVDLSQIRTRVFVEGQLGTSGTPGSAVGNGGMSGVSYTPQLGGPLTEEVTYAMTHVNDNGETHASGSGGGPITLAPGDGSVLLEDLDATIRPEPSVTERRLYRSRTNSQYPYFLVTTFGVATVVEDTYLDTTADEDLGHIAPTSNTTAPVPTVWAQVDDLTAQAALATLEGGGSDGIVEHKVSDGTLTTHAAAVARGEAELALFAYPIVTVTYACRDVKSKSGKTVHVDVTTPPISGDFLIQDVAISELDLDGGPRFLVTASSVRFSLAAILRMALGRTG